MFQSFTAPGGGDTGAARLARLRDWMKAQGYDGVLVPRADAHQGEYVAPCDERLAWLTGFTGSAGFAIATARKKSPVFVDGRYTLQAAAQVDGGAFKVVSLTARPPSKWLAKKAAEGGRFAYDPWLHPRDEVERLTTALTSRDATLAPVSPNPIDQIWDDRPPPPAAAIRPHDEALAGEASSLKRARIGEDIAAAGAEATVLTLPDSIAWLLNIRGADIPRNPVPLVFAILRAGGGVTLFVREGQVDDTLLQHLGRDVHVLDRSAFETALAELAPGPVALDPASCPVAIRDAIEAAGGQIIWRRDPCVLPKATKTEAELEGARAAHRRDGAAVARFMRWFDRKAPAGDLTEIDIAKRLEKERRATNKLLDISFDTISGSGPNGAIVHYRVTRETERVLKPGETMLIDSGGQYRDGTTDITRTMACGEVDKGARRAFTLVLKGMIAISALRFPPGTRGREIDAIARMALWKAGYDYDHGTGHGVGSYLCVHEGPQRIAKAGDAVLQPGMILSNEPGYYREGAFGIRIENLLIVTPAKAIEGGDRAMLGFETLTLAPIDRRMIQADLLSPEERDWLNAYHARVQAEIGTALDEEDAAWLAEACAPL